MSSKDFSDHINSEIIRLADDKITEEMVIAIDPGDIMKPYAKAMENLWLMPGNSSESGT